MRIFLSILLILLAVSTLSICAIKPDMHKSVLVYDSAYKIVPQNQTEVEKETIPILEKQTEPVVTVVRNEVQKTNVSKVADTKTTKTISRNQTVKKEQKQTQKVVRQIPQNIQTTEQKVVQKTPVKKDNVVQKAEQKKITETPKPKTLTRTEEEIAWNVWRSNLQNRIMQEVRLPIIPNGIVFKFSFSVDKFGKISNVQTWSTTPSYTPYAIQYIAPVIRNLQGKSVLVFPSGTARVTTDVTGGWKISDNERYSTPNDYNDVEKIRR